ncbi:MAG: hypothetical protein IJV10_02165 [Prevotella sp.]|nr:hypothetical protein [Prevotella sp.]
MTALQLNAELLRELSVIVDDETLLEKALKYIKKLTAKKADPTLINKDEFLRRLDEAERDIANGKGIEMYPNETLDDLLRRVG